ncbi:hypothetical protein M514_27528 [Trichuris suis]|uniref:Uncharacterized protein n=1 Tax=Trichuris suis TaxID=68888 RepID=A0A085MSW3_9BILA|nr:hypothetical protein M514_27528 [Trichuris suis]
MYARESIHPSLSQVDQDKIAKLYADMRRESDATSSVSITVRHVESIIRLCEAHAKLRLRNYVSADDVSVAMCVILESFIQTQKYSVMRQMRRVFSKYMSFSQDNNHLLLYLLKQCVNEQIRIKTNVLRSDDVLGMKCIEVHELDLLEKVKERHTEFSDVSTTFFLQAKQVKIENLSAFYLSDLFTSNRFKYDKAKKTITQFPESEERFMVHPCDGDLVIWVKARHHVLHNGRRADRLFHDLPWIFPLRVSFCDCNLT